MDKKVKKLTFSTAQLMVKDAVATAKNNHNADWRFFVEKYIDFEILNVYLQESKITFENLFNYVIEFSK